MFLLRREYVGDGYRRWRLRENLPVGYEEIMAAFLLDHAIENGHQENILELLIHMETTTTD